MAEADDVNVDYEAFLKDLGCRIKQFRKERGLSLRDMVVKHGYHDSQWRRYERGGAANMHSLLKIAKAFGTSLSILLDGLGEFPAENLSEIKKKMPVSKPTPTPAKKVSVKGKKKTK
jgi:transcriptional regulator with XRE-family HTH domain